MRGFTIFFLLFLFYFYAIKVSSSNDDCSATVASCGYGHQSLIRFPFSVGFSENTCAYPGFHMSCNKEMNSTWIQIGSWGKFSVQDVDYLAQKVQIYDQHNCLPKRLLHIDLSGSPYRGAHYRNFTFYNCSLEISSNVSRPIGCLSTENHKVFASSNSRLKEVFSSCDVIESIMVPSMSRDPDDTINNELHLVWDMPDCRACVKQDYGECGFKNKESRNLTCFITLPSPKQGREWPRECFILRRVGISLIVACVILMLCFIAGRRNMTPHHHVDLNEGVESFSRETEESVVGLDESVIQSYPKTVLGESGRLAKPEDNTCSICLSQYEAKETLRAIPSCKHCFHAICVDEWLRRNVTCPICRHSTKPRPLAV